MKTIPHGLLFVTRSAKDMGSFHLRQYCVRVVVPNVSEIPGNGNLALFKAREGEGGEDGELHPFPITQFFILAGSL